MILIISIVVLVLALGVGIAAALMLRQKYRDGTLGETSYRSIFVAGLVLTPLGIVALVVYFLLQIPFYIGLPLLVVGLIYLALGLAHRDSWRKPERGD